jgi:hypothetical protein
MAVDLWSVFSGGNAIDTVITVLLIMGGVFIVYMIARILRMMISYKVKVEITDLTRERYIIRYDKGREFQTKAGRQKIGLLKTKGRQGRANIEYPSEKYIDITERGKKFLRLKKIDVDTYIPWHPSIEDPDVNTRKGSYLAPDQKGAFISEYEQSQQYGKKNIWQMLAQAAPFIAIVVAAIMMVIVMDVAAEKHTEIANVNANIANKLASEVDEQNKINTELLNWLQDQNNPKPRLPVDNSTIPD